jgi:protocatechuate 3,4-dioxygenase beta subunit
MTSEGVEHSDWVVSRRRALGLLGSFSVAALAACAGPDGRRTRSSTTASTAVPSSGTSTAVSAAGCSVIPEETEGPFGLDLGNDHTYYRRDITEGRPGVPLELTLALVDVAHGCTPLQGARVDGWHCDKDGVYSGYQQDAVDTVGETFLRGIQMSDARGVVRFNTIYPGWYNGRTTHIHVEVFHDGKLVKTSQLAFPDAITHGVYTSSLYAARGQNSSVAKTADDQVFSDGFHSELLTLAGNVNDGYKGSITVGIDA